MVILISIPNTATTSHALSSCPPHPSVFLRSHFLRPNFALPFLLIQMSSRKWKSKSRRKQPPEPKAPDVSDLIGDTNIANKDVQIYLVKMPKLLCSQFENPENGIIGRLRIPQQPPASQTTKHETAVSNPSQPLSKNLNPKIFLDKLPPHKPNTPTVMSEYDLEIQNSKASMLVFSSASEDAQPAMRLEGSVMHQCLAKPKFDATYRRVNKTRCSVANTTTRELLRMEDSDRKAAERAALKPMSMTETFKQREERKRQKEDARRHLDVPDKEWREYTRVAVFKAFEIQAHYSADQLARDVGEPTARLRSIIAEVCTYNKSGPFAGKYELKDEFKTVSQRQQKERDLEEHRLAQVELIKRRREERTEREKDQLPSLKKPRMN